MIHIKTIAQDRQQGKWCMLAYVLKPGHIDGFKRIHLIEIDNETAQLLINTYPHAVESDRYFNTYTFTQS